MALTDWGARSMRRTKGPRAGAPGMKRRVKLPRSLRTVGLHWAEVTRSLSAEWPTQTPWALRSLDTLPQSILALL